MDFCLTFLNAVPGCVSQGLIWGIMAIGVYLTYRILDVADLTVDGSFATGGAVCVMLVRNGFSSIAALGIALVAGMLAGMVTGVLHVKCKIPAILAGILTQLALYSVNLRIMGNKSNQSVSPDKYSLLVSSRFVREKNLSNPLWILVILTVITIAVLYWFFGTRAGSAIRAVGANEHMAKAQGINSGLAKIVGIMFSNGLVALGGGFLSQYQGSADVNMGRGAIVIGLAAVIIGEVLFKKVFSNFALKLFAVSLGAIIYYLTLQLILLAGLNTNDLKMFTALLVAIFLSVPTVKEAVFRKAKNKKSKQTSGGGENA